MNYLKLVLSLLGLDRQSCVWHCAEPFLGDQLSGFPADTIHFVLDTDLSIFQVLDQLLLA